MKNKKVVGFIVTMTVLIMTAYVLLYPLPYYISKPGSVRDTSQFIHMPHKDQDDQGAFHLTTVSMSRATPFQYVAAQFRDFYEITTIDSFHQLEEDDEEYTIRQLKLMDQSKFNALYVAFRLTKHPYTIVNKGLYVVNVYKHSAADGVLKAGDEVMELNGQHITSKQSFIQNIDQVEKGDVVEIVIKRKEQLLTKQLTVKTIPHSKRAGLGISFVENKTIQTNPKVSLQTEQIGGPSGGLMFTLEILNQLLEEDLTRGYKIAGTGEMFEDGTIGRIGGIEKKIAAAHEAGIDYFLAPNDVVTDEMKQLVPDMQPNYEEAVQAAKKLGTTMKIVPVRTIEEALTFLRSLDDNE